MLRQCTLWLGTVLTRSETIGVVSSNPTHTSGVPYNSKNIKWLFCIEQIKERQVFNWTAIISHYENKIHYLNTEFCLNMEVIKKKTFYECWCAEKNLILNSNNDLLSIWQRQKMDAGSDLRTVSERTCHNICQTRSETMTATGPRIKFHIRLFDNNEYELMQSYTRVCTLLKKCVIKDYAVGFSVTSIRVIYVDTICFDRKHVNSLGPNDA